MSGSLEVRQFLMQQDSSSSGDVPMQRNGDVSRVSDDQVRRARLSVAGSSLDAEDCARLLDMLGLLPGEDGVPPAQR
ncbi:hypothetical protein EV191_1296 [Tamaricihabitans halophyticus]|uniref:Uncharacterized protein n=1 Tax=Tamaricihabitans halophyticus TaxID=1262583 RepID=A0A4R2PZK0_9PSEU|nr:hypothetical protein [Tamaricihabitans halophyticus]TCP40668.1 hypothetical protein EV191_1296 [Tamaricihabitans halophyticus]